MKSTSEVGVVKSKAMLGTFPSVLENLLFRFTSMFYDDYLISTI